MAFRSASHVSKLEVDKKRALFYGAKAFFFWGSLATSKLSLDLLSSLSSASESYSPFFFLRLFFRFLLLDASRVVLLLRFVLLGGGGLNLLVSDGKGLLHGIEIVALDSAGRRGLEILHLDLFLFDLLRKLLHLFEGEVPNLHA